MCGEKFALAWLPAFIRGSPPHVRGKEKLETIPKFYTRITPACAGKRKIVKLPVEYIRDHPRMCGEKPAGEINKPSRKGSPPHVRGKAFATFPIVFATGITPACAGKRLKRSRSTVPPVAIVPLFPSVCNKPVVSDGSPAGRDAPLFLPAENAVPASPAYNLRSL